jgi:hypothetical protein
MFCAAVLCLCWAAFAYPTDTVTVHFANPVTVGDATLPAGDVTITIQHGNPNVMLTFRSESGVAATVLATRISGPANDQRAGTQVILGRSNSGDKVERVWLDNLTGFELAQ